MANGGGVGHVDGCAWEHEHVKKHGNQRNVKVTMKVNMIMNVTGRERNRM